MQKTIGTVTRYTGTEIRYLTGFTVRIIAVQRGTERPGYDPEADHGDGYIDSNEALAALGGVTAADRVIVQPWLERAGRYSFVSSDPRAVDLECFAHLREEREVTTSRLTRRTKTNAPKTARRTRNRPAKAKQGRTTMSKTTVSELQTLPIKELKDRIAKLNGQKLKSNNRPFLARKLAKLLEAADAKKTAKAAARKTATKKTAAKKTTTRKATKKAAPKAIRVSVGKGGAHIDGEDKPARQQMRKKGERDPRLPAAGTVLTREYKGETIRVEVLEDGFLYNGEHCRSLSTVARKATGTIWNGFLFFGIAKRKDEQAAA